MKSNKALKIFIALSLMGNLFLASIMFGHMGHNLIAGKFAQHINIRELADVLPPEKRDSLANEVAKSEHETQALRDQLFEERRKAVLLIRAKPFDKEAYMAQIKVIQDTRIKIIQNVGDIIAKLVEQSTDEEKDRIAAILNEHINLQQQLQH